MKTIVFSILLFLSISCYSQPILISGSEVVYGWTKTPGSTNLYQTTVIHSVSNQVNYDFVYVVEVDTTIEMARPYSARKYLRWTNDLISTDNTAGSFHTTGLASPLNIFIRPTTGIPGFNKYRYYVIVRDHAIGEYELDNKDYQNLYVREAGNGYGPLSAGDNTSINKVVVQGGNTHNSVVKSGIINNAVYLPGPYYLPQAEIAHVFYTSDGTGKKAQLVNSTIFDCYYASLSHTSGLPYEEIVYNNNKVFGNPFYSYGAFSANNTNNLIVKNCYAENISEWGIGTPKNAFIENSIYNKVSGRGGFENTYNVESNLYINNSLFIMDDGDGIPNPQAVGSYLDMKLIRLSKEKEYLDLHNSIISAKSGLLLGSSNLFTMIDMGESASEPAIKSRSFHNVFIVNTDDAQSTGLVYRTFSNAPGTSQSLVSDSNIFIVVHGTLGFQIENTVNGYQYAEFEEWKERTGQDKHSEFIDLRNNSLGLKALFADPQNGNWTLLDNIYTAPIKALAAGLTTPPTSYPIRPTYEEAIGQILGTYTVMPVTLGTVNAIRTTDNLVKVEWQTMSENNSKDFHVEKALSTSSDFVEVGIVNSKATAGYSASPLNYLYSDANNIKATTYYRVRQVDRDGVFRYSRVIAVKGVNSPIKMYPNPTTDLLHIDISNKGNYKLLMINTNGVAVLSEYISMTKSISVSKYPAGVYTVSLFDAATNIKLQQQNILVQK